MADVLEGEPFAQAVVTLVDRSGPLGVTLTASELLERVPTPDRLPKKWPKDSTRAGGQLKRLAPALRTIGIEVDDSERQPKGNRSRLYKLTASESRRKSAPAAPTAPATGSDQQESAGASAEPSTRNGEFSTRRESGAGAAGAGAGAGDSTAPAADTLPDLDGYAIAGAPGAAGAEMQPLSNAAIDARPKTLCAKCGREQWNAMGSPLCGSCRTTV